MIERISAFSGFCCYHPCCYVVVVAVVGDTIVAADRVLVLVLLHVCSSCGWDICLLVVLEFFMLLFFFKGKQTQRSETHLERDGGA